MSSLLERVIVAHRCRSTHHYIAIEALGLLETDDPQNWQDLFLLHHEELLKGAKAPDAVFKDFKNHVLHIGEGEWGGARDKATEWYAEAVAALKRKKWADAAYALGVLSHYYADPIQPFHTGQTEEEGAIHRALEWSVAKSRNVIKAKIEETGYPKVEAGAGLGFVSDMVRAGAERSHPHYQTLIDHYDLDTGVKNPPAGLDQTLIDIFADLVAYATAGFATLVSRAVIEAGVAAPKTHLSLPGYLATLDIPIRWVSKKLSDAGDRRTVERMYAELQKTGKVIRTLPSDDKAIRKLHAKQVLRIPLKELDAKPLGPLGTKHVPISPPEGIAPEVEEQAKPSAKSKKTKQKQEAAKTSNVPASEPISAATKPNEPEPAPSESKTKKRRSKKKKAASVPATIETPVIEEPVSDTSEEIYETKETWIDPDDQPTDATTSDEEINFAGEAETETVTSEPLDPELAAELEAQLEAELEAEIEAELAAERANALEEDLQAELEAEEVNVLPSNSDTDDSHWRVGKLQPDSPIVEAPSIGRKTAERLGEVGIITVRDLMETDCEVAAELLDVRYITEDTLIDWQDQAELMMTVPGLRTHDAQVLVGAGIRSADELAMASASDIFRSAVNFLSSPEGDRIARDDEEFKEAEVEHWIDLARQTAA
ncbi:MAG: DUF4332 domain-containing protein [Pseudomonadota bacterium]